jgi:tetratricopeptide (TPR) repeat protein
LDADVQRLCRYSLISKSRNGNDVYLNVHRQVKRHVLNRLTTQQLEQGSRWAIHRLRQLFPRQSPFAGELDDKIPDCAPCIKHILALKTALPIIKRPINEPEVLASLYLDGGIYLWGKGLLEDGKALTGESKALCDSRNIDLSMTSQVYSFHASILSDSGEMEQGLEYFEKSLHILKRHLTSIRDTALDTDRALLANAWNNLGGIYCAIGDYDRAEMYNELSLRQKQKLADEGLAMSHLLCLSYQNMANTYAGQRRYEEAAEFFEKAIEVATLEESTARRALTSHNYGIMRFTQNEVEVARQLFETAYQLRAEKIGDHPDTAASLHMLACCYHTMEDPDSWVIARSVNRESVLRGAKHADYLL